MKYVILLVVFVVSTSAAEQVSFKQIGELICSLMKKEGNAKVKSFVKCVSTTVYNGKDIETEFSKCPNAPPFTVPYTGYCDSTGNIVPTLLECMTPKYPPVDVTKFQELIPCILGLIGK